MSKNGEILDFVEVSDDVWSWRERREDDDHSFPSRAFLIGKVRGSVSPPVSLSEREMMDLSSGEAAARYAAESGSGGGDAEANAVGRAAASGGGL